MRLRACLPSFTRQRLKPGVFTSIVELQAAVNRFISETNDKPKPFVSTKSADAILAAAQRGNKRLKRSTRLTRRPGFPASHLRE